MVDKNDVAADHEHRITVTETNVISILLGIEEIKKIVSTAAEQRVDLLTAVSTVLAHQESFNKYQEACDADRLRLVNANTNLGRRLYRVENFQGAQRKAVAGIAAVAGFLAYGGGKLLEKIGAWFSS